MARSARKIRMRWRMASRWMLNQIMLPVIKVPNARSTIALAKIWKIGVGVEWRFLESNRWLYKEIYSRQDKPPSSLIEDALSSSLA